MIFLRFFDIIIIENENQFGNVWGKISEEYRKGIKMYKAYITYVKNIRPAENSDFLNACEVFGNTTIIDTTIKK